MIYKITRQKDRPDRPDRQAVETDRQKGRQTDQTDMQKVGPERLTEKLNRKTDQTDI